MMPTTYFTQEIGVGCNLADQHVRCPAHWPDRYRGNLDRTRLMSEDTLVANAIRAWDRGFRGHYAWHLYSEPTLHFERIERVQARIRHDRPRARFCLWTNGLRLGTDIAIDRCRIFHRIIVSNYRGEDPTVVRQRFAHLPAVVKVLGARLDFRMRSAPVASTAPCKRYGSDLEIDAYGNWRLCCMDWEGTAVHMNVHTHGIDALLDAYEALQPAIAADPQPASVPAVCRTCRTRGRR